MALVVDRKLVFILKACVSGIALYFVFSKTDIKQIFYLLKGISLPLFLSGAALYILAQLTATFRWKFLLPEKFKTRRLFAFYMIGAFFSTFLPSVVGGDAMKVYYLNKDAKKIGFALASVFMDRYIGYVSLMVIGISAFPFTLDYFSGLAYRWVLPIIFISFIIGSYVFFNLRIGRRFRAVSDFYDYFKTLKTRKDAIVKAFVLSLLVQFLNFSIVIILAVGLGENIPILVLFVFLPIIITVTALPISISGLGVREGSSVLLLGLIGIGPEVATSLSFAWFFAVVVGSLPGLIIYMSLSSDQKSG